MNIKMPEFNNDSYIQNPIEDIRMRRSRPVSRRTTVKKNPLKYSKELNHSKVDVIDDRQFLTIDHTDKKRSDSNGFLPDVGAFKQNDIRAEDLEVEERALMNLYAQDFDDLKLLNILSGNKDIYEHKVNQYKEMSQLRIEAEK